MNKRVITLLLAAGIAVIFAATGIQAGTTVEDTLTMQDKGYKKHKKGLVTFSHKKHAEEYGATCADCHHDKDGKPLADLKMGDDVKKCSECHNKFKKDKKNKKDIMVHENAMHGNCIDCHKAFNKKENPKDKKGVKGPAPASCGKCHPKKKK
ncbi:MAG: cytochrome c3 family protein [Desulfobacter sp.]|nr:MAG: cytochrome c3 family protein [Desulfobacter sp.]